MSYQSWKEPSVTEQHDLESAASLHPVSVVLQYHALSVQASKPHSFEHLFHPFSTTNKDCDRMYVIFNIGYIIGNTANAARCIIGKPHNGQDSWGRLNHTHVKRRFKKSTTADQRANESFRSFLRMIE